MNINNHTVNGTHPQFEENRHTSYLRKGIRLEMHKEAFREWCRERRTMIEDMANAGHRPSIDRINSDGHYQIDNIRVLPLSENISRASNGKKQSSAQRKAA